MKKTLIASAAATLATVALTAGLAMGAGTSIPVTLTPNGTGYDCNAVVGNTVQPCTLNVGPKPTASAAPATPTPTPTATPTPTPTSTQTAPQSPAAVEGATPMPLGVAGNWTLAFRDEFDGPALDTTKWSPSWFGGGTMNKVATPASNVSIVDGKLLLKLSDYSNGALVNTNPSDKAKPGFTMTTGYVEAKILFPGTGWATGTDGCYNWPAFWTDGQSWPTNGENDIAEVLSGKMTVNYHSGSGSHNQGVVPGAWCGAYHVYGMHRMANSVDVYFDGVKVKSYPTDDGNAPQYIILNVGRSGTNPVYGDASTVKVEYVRAWK